MARRLLIVEDDPDIAGLLVELFSSSSYEAESTASGVEALLRMSKSRFDLALLDIDVEDLGGLAVQRAVRDYSDVPTIVMSARAAPWRAEALRAGATACLEKPFGVAALLRLVDAILSLGEPRRGWTSDVRSLDAEDLARVRGMSKAKLDALPFGVIRLDREGRITAYNAYEAEAAREEASAVIGLPFAALAPCVKVKSFMRVIDRARAGEGLDEVIRFVFPRHGSAARVSVRLYAEPGGPLWLFVSQRRD